MPNDFIVYHFVRVKCVFFQFFLGGQLKQLRLTNFRVQFTSVFHEFPAIDNTGKLIDK